ncbi:hypothetical protein DPMN_009510 [Dreissena polymorpha]|uniref:Uncharacterized protein n=1 Tax=Dreissena polymorpha TaxID=45954 RepID=A0A9D4MY73_DREPO|nr:hypothetical protein DPMN_009510 [Dreissena polymorpha]
MGLIPYAPIIHTAHSACASFNHNTIPTHDTYMRPADPDTIMTSLKNGKVLSSPYGDQQLYRDIILRLGGMHFLMSFVWSSIFAGDGKDLREISSANLVDTDEQNKEEKRGRNNKAKDKASIRKKQTECNVSTKFSEHYDWNNCINVY